MTARRAAQEARQDPVIGLVLSGALVGAGIQLRLGRFDGLALGLVIVGLGVLIAVVESWRRRNGVVASVRPRVVRALVVVHLLAFLPLAAEIFRGSSAVPAVTASVAGATMVVAAIDLVGGRPQMRGGSHLLTVAFGVLGVCWLLTQGTTIDVYSYQETGARRLLAGESPWAPGYPNPYDPGASAQFFGPGLADGDTVNFGFPYPPLSLLLSTLGYLGGDLRYAHLASVALSGWLLCGPTGRSWSMRAGGVLLLTSPMVLPTVQRGWTEMFLLGALVATFLVLRHSRGSLAPPVAIGLLLAVKQYAAMFLPVLLMLVPRWRSARERLGVGAAAVAVATVVTLPMALWGFRDFVHSVVTLQLRQPFRPDAMSVPALLERTLGWPGETIAVIGMVVALVGAMAWVLARAPRTWWGAAAGVAVTILAFLLFNKQAFTNYYMFAVGSIWLAVAMSDDGIEDRVTGGL